MQDNKISNMGGQMLEEQNNQPGSPLTNPGQLKHSKFLWFKRKTEQPLPKKDSSIDANLQAKALEASADAIVITDIKGVILWFNPAFTKLTGYEPSEAVGKNMSILKSGKQDSAHYQNFWKEVLGGLFVRHEIINRRKDGSLYHEEETVTPVSDQNGKVIYFIAVKRDVSERIKEKEALTKAKLYSEALINSMVDGIWITNLRGETTDLNPAMTKMIGYDKQEMLGRSPVEFVSEDEKDGIGKVIIDLVTKGIPGNGESKLITKNGGSIPISYKSTTAKDGAGKTIGVFAVVRDITELKQAEELTRKFSVAAAVEKAKAEEAQMVTEKLKEIDKSKDEFFSIASHELRTPLAAIRGNASMIRDHYANKSDDPDFKEMVSDINEASVRLIDIVNDFLDTSRLEQNRMKFNFKAFDIVELVESTAQFFNVSEVTQQNHLEMQNPNSVLPSVWADYDRTKQVLVNLIGNALKFTENGRVMISLELQKGFVKTVVSDTGRGMTPEAQKFLFRKFEQTGNDVLTRDSVRGTGLGLYISKMITEQMGGHIQLDSSEIGVGTSFSFSLPVATPLQTPKATA